MTEGEKREIYFDNSATTKALPEVVEAMTDALQVRYGNPSSLHEKGLEAERLVKSVRRRVASFVGADDSEIHFTSGATEGNNLVIRGTVARLSRQGDHIVTTEIEHPSVVKTCERLEDEGFRVTWLPVSGEGRVSVEDLRNCLSEETVLVSIMAVNNEVGSLQPVEEIGLAVEKFRRRSGSAVVFHSDAVQLAGKMPLDVSRLRSDLVTFSAHKFHGPKGAAVLYVRDGVRLTPLMAGGEQEAGMRPGTENVPAIAGLGAAVEAVEREGIAEQGRRLRKLKRRLWEGIEARFDDFAVNGPSTPEEGAPHILNVSFPGVKAEVLVHYLESEKIYVSTGSACSSRKPEPSRVLRALGVEREVAESGIRFSFGHFNTESEVERCLDVLEEGVSELRSFGT